MMEFIVGVEIVIHSSTHISDGSVHMKGAINLDGIAIIAGNNNQNVKIYNITKGSPPTFNILATKIHTNHVYSCFLHNYENAICIDSAGYAMKYNLHTLLQSDFYYAGNEALYSGIQTRDKLVILGDLFGGKIYILDEYGNQIDIHLYPSSGKSMKLQKLEGVFY